MTPSDDPEAEPLSEVVDGADEVAETDDTQPPAAPATPAPVRQQPGRFRRFVRSVFSHLIFAGLVLAGASFYGYLNNQKIMRDVGNTVCSEKIFGNYLSKGGKTAVATADHGSHGSSTAPADATQTASQAAGGSASTGATNATGPAAEHPSAMPAGRTPPMPVADADANANTPEKTATADNKSAAPVAHKTDGSAAPAAPPTQQQASAGKAPEASATDRQQTAALKSQTHATRPAAMPQTAAIQQPRNRAPAPSTASRQSPQAAARPSPVNQPAISLASALREARQAQAAGKPDADKIYKRLIRQFPDSPDLPGELGNIYYVQGKLSEAAEQYFETARRLIRRHQPGQAACLIAVLKRIAPAKAEALARQTSQRCPTRRRR